MTDTGETTADDGAELRAEILDLVRRFAAAEHAPKPFAPGETVLPASGKVYGAEEMCLLVESALDFWLTTGRFNAAFQKRLGEIIGARYVLTANSGSSANLLAVSALTSELLGERALKPGDEAITVAAGFPTTVNPILLQGLTPVFVDVEIPTYNADPDLIEAAITERTRAIVLAHTLGNPFQLDRIAALAEKHGLWLVEDCCDALGSTYGGKPVGGFGDVGTLSFYPAHQISMGEGGAVFTANSLLKRVLESMRDWGRDCWCEPGMENTCRQRFDWQLGELPHGYDHKYIYSHLGFNLKLTDMQAAVGLAQLDRLPDFIATRRRNFARLHEMLKPLEDVFILPEATAGSDPSWFGFLLTLRDDAPVGREALTKALNARRIGTRLLFGGNLTRQPYFKGREYRVHGTLEQTDRVMRQSFWIGVHPGLPDGAIAYMAEAVSDIVRSA